MEWKLKRLNPSQKGKRIMENREMKSFEDLSDAFDYCREKDCPVIVLVKGEKWKLFPSGCAQKQ